MAETLPISGYIDPKAFPFLLVDLHKQGATGSLKVEGGRHQKALYFRAGRVLFGSSNDPRDQLGAILIESGKITEQQLEDVNKKVGPGNPLARALSDSGIVSQRELSEAARAKVERILSDVLSYETGSFEFEDGVLPKGAVDLKLAPERLFLAAVRRVKDRGFVLRHLDGMDVVLSERSNFQERLPEIESELGGLAPYLDGQRTLKEAASLAALDDFDAAKIGCGLVFLGLVDKGSTLVIVNSAEEAPFFASAEGEGEGELGLLSPPEIQAEADEPLPTMPFSPVEEKTAPTEILEESELAGTTLPGAALAGTANDTLVLGSVPSFSLPEPPSPDLAFEAPPEPVLEEPAPMAEPEPVIPQSTEPPPLRIIQPPERSRPPAKASQADLEAIDDLLSKPSPEGPLHPVEKPVEDQWKPQLGPRGGKRAKSFTLDRTLGIWIVAGLIVGAAVAGWMYWTGVLGIGPQRRVVTTASPSAAPLPPSTTLVAPSTAPSTEPASPSAGLAASASPEPASSAVVPSPAATASAAQPAPAGSAPAVGTHAGGMAPPASTPARSSPTAGASQGPTAAHSSSPGSSKPAAEPAAGSATSADAKSLLRSGHYPDAARAFEAGLRGQKAGYSVLILVACKPETIDKAVGSVGGDDLFILPMNYQGKDCYRMVWGLYGSEPAADAGARDLPAYFVKNGARPRVVKVADMLR